MVTERIIYGLIGVSLLGVGGAGLYERLQPKRTDLATVTVSPDWASSSWSNSSTKVVYRWMNFSSTEDTPPEDAPPQVVEERLAPKLLISLNLTSSRPHTNEEVVLTASTKIENGAAYKLSGTLTGVGLKIEPSKSVPFVSTSGDQQLVTASWVIQPKEPNRYSLIFTPTLEDSTRTQEARRSLANPGKTNSRKQSFEDSYKQSLGLSIRRSTITSLLNLQPTITVEGGTIIQLDVISKWTDYFSKGWPPFVTFMGSLLTLPGIISFFKTRKAEENKTPEPTEPLPF